MLTKKARFLPVDNESRKANSQIQAKAGVQVHYPSADPIIIETNQDQQVPQQSTVKTLKSQVKRQKAKFNFQFLLNQDPRQSRFSHDKLLILEKLSCILTILIFFLACGKTEIDIAYKSPNHEVALYLMNTLSICTFALMAVIFIRYLCVFELQSIQKKVYVPKNSKEFLLEAFFKRSEKMGQLLLQMFIILLHPCSIFTGATFQLFQTMNEIYINHSYNDILSLLLSAKIYIIIRSFLTLTSYSSPRANRLCNQNGLEHDIIYIIKCVLHQQPLVSIAICFGILMMLCGYCLKLSEGVLFLYNPGLVNGFDSYSNCLWCIFITMSTIGYGDYYPKTLPGRSVILFTSICGVFISSLLIVSLSLHLQMQPGENKSHVVLTRLGKQAKLKEEAAQAVAQTAKIQAKMSQSEPYPDELLQKDFQKLKKHIELSKARSRKIKSLVDTDDIVEEMSRLFYILKDNLKDIYDGQLRLKTQIDRIEQVQKIKQSFIREVSGMLSHNNGENKDSLTERQKIMDRKTGQLSSGKENLKRKNTHF